MKHFAIALATGLLTYASSSFAATCPDLTGKYAAAGQNGTKVVVEIAQPDCTKMITTQTVGTDAPQVGETIITGQDQDVPTGDPSYTQSYKANWVGDKLVVETTLSAVMSNGSKQPAYTAVQTFSLDAGRNLFFEAVYTRLTNGATDSGSATFTRIP